MQKIAVRINKIVPETPDAASFYLENVDGTSIEYIAGQFLTLLFTINGKEVRRSFSIGSAPVYEDLLFITVKRKENGEISRMLLDKYHEGDILMCLLPAGKFIHEKVWGNDIKYFFFAAGSGIVPIFSILKSVLNTNPKVSVFLLNQSVSESTTIYKRQLEKLAIQHTNFEYIQYWSRPDNHQIPITRLNNLAVERLINARLTDDSMRANARFYVCGPITFMRFVRFTLRLDGFSEEQIKQEQFVIQEKRSTPPLMKDESPKKVTILSEEGRFEFEVQYPSTILSAARKHNIALPYSCGAGQCSTCAVLCKEGEVLMSSNDILTQKELEKGLVLTCTGHPVSNIVLDYTVKL